MIRTKYGPFVVLRSENLTQKRKRAVVPPLIDLNILLDAARNSTPLSKSLMTAGRLLGYTEWASRRLSQDPSVCSAKQVVAADAIANRHGLSGALHIGAVAAAGHPWAFDESWISEYSQEERITSPDHQTTRRALNEVCGCPPKGGYEYVPENKRALSGSSPVRKRASLPSAVRMAVWNKHFGREAGAGECYCCREKIYQQAFECGHILAAAKGGSDAIDNLRPLCRNCNLSMRDDHMDDFMRIYFPNSVDDKVPETKEPRIRIRAKRSGATQKEALPELAQRAIGGGIIPMIVD
jgi:5-methylcytosine-specific restriction endonuclease McrA